MINIIMNALTATPDFYINTLIYKEFLDEKEEILKHKWFESEKRGYDIGYSAALIDWIFKHKSGWKNHRKFRT